MSRRNIYSDSLGPSHGRERGAESCESDAHPGCLLSSPQVMLLRAFGIPAGWVSLCEMTAGFAGNVSHHCIGLT